MSQGSDDSDSTTTPAASLSQAVNNKLSSLGSSNLRVRNASSPLATYRRVVSPLHSALHFDVSPTTAPVSSHINTPTRMSRDPADKLAPRARALSRPSSFPSLKQETVTSKTHDGVQDFQNVESSLSPTVEVGHFAPTRHSSSSVKHLTCFWWKEKGTCRFSAEDCLYAHFDTGNYTDPPRQLFPGEPAMAGRKLDRAMRNLAITAHRSSGSLSSLAGSRQASRPSTPMSNAETVMNPTMTYSSPMTSPIALVSQHIAEIDVARLSTDNQFLRTLVDQNGKEKAIMISTIETLQSDNKGMKGELEGLRMAQEQLLAERDGLHKRIQQFEELRSQDVGATRGSNNPFGAIGRARVNTETRYLGDLLKDD